MAGDGGGAALTSRETAVLPKWGCCSGPPSVSHESSGYPTFSPTLGATHLFHCGYFSTFKLYFEVIFIPPPFVNLTIATFKIK